MINILALLLKKYNDNKMSFLFVIILITFSLVATGLTFVNFAYEKDEFYKKIDENLLIASRVIKEVLPDNFHDNMTSNSVTKEQDKANCLKISKLIEDTYIKYIYTAMKIDGKFYFIASSFTPEEIAKDDCYVFFNEYPECPPKLARMLSLPEKYVNRPVLEVYKDRWGEFRSIFTVERTQSGTYYVVGADYDLTYIHKVLGEHFIKTIIMFFIIWLIGATLIVTLFRNFKRKLEIEESLLKLEKEKEVVMNNISDTIIEYIDVKSKKIIWINDYAKKKFNLNTADLVDKTHCENLACDKRIGSKVFPCNDCMIEKTVKLRKNIETEKTINGIPYYSKCFPIFEANGEINKVIKMDFDISKLKNLENSLNESIKVKDEFLANISHEIKNPIVAIQSYINLLSRKEMSPDEKEYFNIVDRQLISLINIINNVLEITNINFKPFKIKKTTFNLKQFVSDLMIVINILAKEKGLLVFTDLENDLPSNIISDIDKLKQILNNLLTNAVKYSVKGYIQLKIQKIGHSNRDKHETLAFSVIDTGIGIPKDKLSEIFEPFKQIENSQTERYNGVGLGLDICKKLVEKMGGKIEVDSLEGKGSRFTFVMDFEIPTLAPVRPNINATRREQNDRKH